MTSVPFDPVGRSNATAGSSFARGLGRGLLRRLRVTLLATAAAATTFPAADAAMIPTDALAAAAATSAPAASARAQVAAFLARDDVRTQMRALGVDGDEAAARLAALSDAEVERLGARLADLPAGAGLPHAVGAVLFVAGVLLLTDLLCFTNIFRLNLCVLH